MKPSAHTAIAWLAHIRFVEEWVVGVHAMNNENAETLIVGSVHGDNEVNTNGLKRDLPTADH